MAEEIAVRSLRIEAFEFKPSDRAPVSIYDAAGLFRENGGISSRAQVFVVRACGDNTIAFCKVSGLETKEGDVGPFTKVNADACRIGRQGVNVVIIIFKASA